MTQEWDPSQLSRESQSEKTSRRSMTGAVTHLFPVFLTLSLPGAWAVNWLEWWTYDGISGPSFWGLINPEWSLCNQGLR